MAEWLAVITITIFAVISPGPDFAMVSRNSLSLSRRAGILTAFGIGAGVLIATFDYSYLPLAAILGFLLWGEIPPYTTFIGMVLIVSSGIYTAYRELRIERGADYNMGRAQTVSTHGAPAGGGHKNSN